MSFVIAVAQRKGGAGKSTLASNLATALVASGSRVALLDTDPQKSLTKWRSERGVRASSLAGIAFDDPSGWRVPAALDRLRREVDYVVIDTPPHVEIDAKLVIRGSDLVLVPLQPSLADLWAMDATLEFAAGEGRPVRIVFNRVPPQSRLRSDIEAKLQDRRLSVLECALGNRAAFVTAFAYGMGVVEAAPRSVAAEEARALALEVEGLKPSMGRG